MNRLRQIEIENLLFLYIETATKEKNIVPEMVDYEHWVDKAKWYNDKDIDYKENYLEKASAYPEFAKIVSISLGSVINGELKIVSYSSENEKQLLNDFMMYLINEERNPNKVLCGYSLSAYVLPFIYKRSIVNGVIPSSMIDIGGMKSWNLQSLDINDYWRATGFYSSSIKNVCFALGLDINREIKSREEISNMLNSDNRDLKKAEQNSHKVLFALANIVRKMRFEKVFPRYYEAKPSVIKKEKIIDKIARVGVISETDKTEILLKAKGYSYIEKETLIKLLTGALGIKKVKLPQDFELKILEAN